MGVFYPPSDLSLDDLITAAQAAAGDDTAAMAAILRRFERDIVIIANQAAADWHLRQDAQQGARLGLIKAVRAHTPGTDGFVTYARRYMRCEARRTVEHMSGHEIPRDPDVLHAPQPTDRPGVLRQRDLAVAESAPPFEFETVIAGLAPAQQTVARRRYAEDRTVADIAAGLGVSVPAVSQRLKTIHAALRPILVEAVAA
jgi:RNA polymerase sigma factor (sigma-70 family)